MKFFFLGPFYLTSPFKVQSGSKMASPIPSILRDVTGFGVVINLLPWRHLKQ